MFCWIWYCSRSDAVVGVVVVVMMMVLYDPLYHVSQSCMKNYFTITYFDYLTS